MLAPKMEELAKEIPVEKIDVDEDSETAAKYGIQSIPTVIVVVDGEENECFANSISELERDNWMFTNLGHVELYRDDKGVFEYDDRKI
jgi:thioredoxin-like negative regulator of GroEL